MTPACAIACRAAVELCTALITCQFLHHTILQIISLRVTQAINFGEKKHHFSPKAENPTKAGLSTINTGTTSTLLNV
jgi:hypothetical protein